MKRSLLIGLWVLVVSLGMALPLSALASGEPLDVLIQLVWATNDEKPPTHHRPLDPTLEAKLRGSPYRWTNYYEVNRQFAGIPAGGTNAVHMSSRCMLNLKNLGNDRLELQLYGQGKLVSTHKEKVAKDWPLVLSGNADNHTAWLVVVTKVDPTTMPSSVTQAH